MGTEKPEFSSDIPLQSESGLRRTEKKEIAEAYTGGNFIVKKIHKTTEQIRAVISPEKFIGERDVALFRAAGYSKEEIKWIAEVKTCSNEENPADLNAYDLVRVHAMLAKDFKKSPGIIGYQTEEYLDEVLTRIAQRYEHLTKLVKDDEKLPWFADIYSRQALNFFRQYKNVHIAEDKASLLTRWLNLVHTGGNREVLEMFGGYPKPSGVGNWRELQMHQANFLFRLNNLGASAKVQQTSGFNASIK